MGNVFANSLEISGKAVNAQTIADFPDVCFTPPENPATPPGVPIPYPSFGIADDTDKGTGTVKIGGKTVNIKNQSYLSKTSGTEAGCAAKKGVITSKNIGKEYFNSWSNNVKFDSEPVVRNTDLATNNHASPVGNAPPWPHLAGLSAGGVSCEAILAELEIVLHKHSDKTKACDWENTQQDSEHMLQNALMQNERGGKSKSIPGFDGKTGGKGYSSGTAPAICMGGPSSQSSTPHGAKTRDQEAFAAACGDKRPTVKEALASEMASIRRNEPKIANAPKEKQDQAMECLELVIYDHLQRATGKSREEVENTELRIPGSGEITAAPPTPTPATSL